LFNCTFTSTGVISSPVFTSTTFILNTERINILVIISWAEAVLFAFIPVGWGYTSLATFSSLAISGSFGIGVPFFGIIWAVASGSFTTPFFSSEEIAAIIFTFSISC
jgi:hypothetical protein